MVVKVVVYFTSELLDDGKQVYRGRKECRVLFMKFTGEMMIHMAERQGQERIDGLHPSLLPIPAYRER